MKKFIVSLLMLISLGMIAQDKIAVVDYQAILNIMPEVSEMETQLANLQQQYQKELKTMQDEYNRKYSDLQAQNDSLTENIKMLRLQEIEDINTRMQNFVPMARENIEKKQNELLTPIQNKIEKAVSAVGEENGYTYIIDPRMLLYKSPNATDATDKVKAKLGLK